MTRGLHSALWLLLIAGAAAPSTAKQCGTWGGQCGDRTPALPAPECVDPATSQAASCSSAGAVRLWSPSGFHPAEVLQLPAKRDSTNRYQGQCLPGERDGVELYRSLDIAGNRLFAAYNAGIVVWDIGPGHESAPLWLSQVDGWLGRIWAHPESTNEQLNFIQGVAALDHASGVTYVVASGYNPVGTSIWELDPSTQQLRQLFQDGAADSRDVRIFELGGNPFAVSVAAAATNDPVRFYDLAAARALRDAGTKCCLGCDPLGLRDTAAVTSGCGGTVRLGALPKLNLHRYVDVTVVDGKAYVATANPLTNLRLYELAAPLAPSAASLRFTGPLDVSGPAFIEVGSTVYLAWVRDKVIEIYDATSCLDGDGCTSLGPAVYTRSVRDVPTTEQFLTVSTGSGGRRYLYYGCNGCPSLSGSAVEQLLDITALGPNGLQGAITEVTSGGGTYTDSCPEGSGPTVDYWGRYYPSNHYGLNGVQPHVGMFKGRYFYRAADSILDVHVRGTGSGAPTVTTSATVAAPHYLNSAIGFTASESSCAGSGAWQWNTTLTPSSGLGSTTASASLVWPYCGGSRCSDQPVEVWALKSDCAGADDLVIDKASLTLVDPRPEVLSIQHAPAGGAQPVCTVLDLSATTVGKPPLTHSWTVRRAGVPGEAGIVATSSSAAWSWDTSGIVLGPELFLDGFESGGTGAWSDAQGLPAALRPATKAAEKAVSSDFEIELVVNNSTNAPHAATETVTLSTLGALGFGAPAVTVVDLGGGAYRFTASTENATEWRWEFADPANGGAAGCRFFALCQVHDFANDRQTVDFAWTPPNVPGSFGVVVTAASCEDARGVSHSFAQSVPDIQAPAVPAMTGFYVNPLTPCTFDQLSGGYACPRNQAITFSVSATGSPTTYEIDWDGSGSFDQSIAVGGPVTHTYTSSFSGFPRARAKNAGGASAAVYLRNPTNSVTAKLTAQ